MGSKIFSPADGVVVKSKNVGGKCGGFLKIKHDNGLQTKYCHLSNFSIVSKNQRVQKGQLVGLSGGEKGAPYAGNSMGPHVHYEVLKGKTHIDPASVHRFS